MRGALVDVEGPLAALRGQRATDLEAVQARRRRWRRAPVGRAPETARQSRRGPTTLTSRAPPS
eukprot:4659642-Pyramimonas_sp.AAC.1